MEAVASMQSKAHALSANQMTKGLKANAACVCVSFTSRGSQVNFYNYLDSSRYFAWALCQEAAAVWGPVAAAGGHCKSEPLLLWLSSDRCLCQPADVPLFVAAAV